MKSNSILLASLITISLSGCIINVNGASTGPLNHQKKQLQMDANDIDTLVAETGAGDLKILGVEGLSQIMVTADIYTYGDIESNLSLKQSGSKATLVAEFDSSINFQRSPYIDLTIQVPSSMVLDIDDGSGDIEIKGLSANITLDDGSGDVWIKGGNDLNIQDGSGSVEISNTTGKLNLEDGSGSISLSSIGGDTHIDDGSGDLSVENVNGHVVIDDGSGDINVDNTLGLSIIESGSGDLSVDNINGSVSMH
ncbi:MULTISPECIES: hypothetical protein [unclassified Shewanella]|uniref:hypothetical protein n=1 Tax=unclassified Shewanella TaxID=196818 RepID=UPI001BBB89C5|nr:MULTISPECIES: hypothetical protein [unclassified Shewanella]GIU15045.1 hypothetical protein TUM4444_25680 [Shewanella sp. MBTL60-112-B1]GIU39108.1 hypothetical protein TUM4445_34650 [Shewanella sp. MBTL60-112-B2]